MEQRREQLRTRSQQWHTQRGMELGELQQNKEDITVFGSYSRSSGNTGTGSLFVLIASEITDMDLRGRAAEVPPMYYRCASIVKTVCSVRVHTKGMS
ncbi:hypothetical protein PC113_g17539 [Phytophthora cactorum]|uniref:Uncharacterized protein n=1 Tax=Phytophthora cactorum TaxID=29920 RepID=A0A8T0YE91_9STRA|nr:hypothetical protein PC113_g17539 [Phytophthora cactorum]